MRKKKQANIKNKPPNDSLLAPQITQVSTAEDWKFKCIPARCQQLNYFLLCTSLENAADKAAALTSSGGKFHTNYSENVFPAMLKWLKSEVFLSLYNITAHVDWLMPDFRFWSVVLTDKWLDFTSAWCSWLEKLEKAFLFFCCCCCICVASIFNVLASYLTLIGWVQVLISLLPPSS